MEPCPKKIILAVDDEPGIRSVIREIVSTLGHIVLTASSGGEAVRRAATVKPHLLILDVNMPGIDGWQTLDEIRQASKDPSLPAIMCSAAFSNGSAVCDEDMRNCVRISKPFNIGEFETHIERMLKGKSCHKCEGSAGASA